MKVLSRTPQKTILPQQPPEEPLNNLTNGIKKCAICEKNVKYKFVIPSKINTKRFSCPNCGFTYAM